MAANVKRSKHDNIYTPIDNSKSIRNIEPSGIMRYRVDISGLGCDITCMVEFVCMYIHIYNKYSENAKSCKALVIMYINKFILFTFS